MKLVAACVGCLVACGGDGSDYAALFDPPTTSPTDGLYGTWGGDLDSLAIRWVFASDRAAFAVRCGNLVVGIDIDAAISPSEIRFLEDVMAGDERCNVHANMATIPACTNGYTECFRHEGLTLELFGTGDSVTLTKLSDETP